jgi:hypothetical protein
MERQRLALGPSPAQSTVDLFSGPVNGTEPLISRQPTSGPANSDEPAATLVEAAEPYGSSPIWGQKLTREGALVHPRLQAFWEIAPHEAWGLT